MKTWSIVIVGVVAVLGLSAGGATCRAADEYQVAALESGPPEGVLEEGVSAAVQSTGVAVKRGSRAFCNFWLAKDWKSLADFEPTLAVQYPFTNGQFMGVVEYKRTGADYRGQEIAAGVYTLRYAQQPVDGNHVGTSETRDFLLLLPVAEDTAVDPVVEETLIEASKKAAQSAHPCMLCLVKPEAAGDAAQLEHAEEHDWWLLSMTGSKTDGGTLPIKVVIVGKAPE